MLSQNSAAQLRPKCLALHGILRVEGRNVVLDGGDADERLGGQWTEALQIADQGFSECGFRPEGDELAPPLADIGVAAVTAGDAQPKTIIEDVAVRSDGRSRVE